MKSILPGIGILTQILTKSFYFYFLFYWSNMVQIKIKLASKAWKNMFSTQITWVIICWTASQHLLKILRKIMKNQQNWLKIMDFLNGRKCNRPNIFFSQNLLLTQENILGNLNFIIGTVVPSLKNQKGLSKKFFSKKKFFSSKFCQKAKKSWKISKNEFFTKWSEMLFSIKIPTEWTL